MLRRGFLVLAGVAVSLTAVAASASTVVHRRGHLAFSDARRLADAPGGTEPQVTAAPDGTRYLITGANTTTSTSGTVRIYWSSPSSTSWRPTLGQMVGVRQASPDVAITASSTGRLVAVEEDAAALSLVVNYSDDGGRTWRESTGLSQLADQDRPWLAAGPHGTVYLLFHNGFSSNATHNMYVATSTDGGASFGLPVPITLPGSAAWADLQCADSGGPSALLANPRTGRLYAVWGTRHGPFGGCGVQPPTPFTLVPADRIWVATSSTGAADSWTTSLAVDDSATGSVVGMQLSPAALDRSGNLWLAWTTPPHGFPDDAGAGIAIAHTAPLLRRWSRPLVVVAARQPGHLLVQLVAGAPGRVGIIYLAGTGPHEPRWYPMATIVTGALGTDPSIRTTRLSSLADYKGSATALEGSGCDPSTSPVATVEDNPVTCPRSADVVGLTLDRQCRMVATWPSLSAKSNAVLGVSTDATWVATQTTGPWLCG